MQAISDISDIMIAYHICCGWLKRLLVAFWKSINETLGSPPAASIIAETWQTVVVCTKSSYYDVQWEKERKFGTNLDMNLPNQEFWKLTCWSVPCCPKDTKVLARSSLLITPSLSEGVQCAVNTNQIFNWKKCFAHLSLSMVTKTSSLSSFSLFSLIILPTVHDKSYKHRKVLHT